MSNERDDTFDLPPELASKVEQVRQAKLDPKTITAALMSADSDVELPGRSRPASMVSNLLALAVGDNYTKSVRVPDDQPLSEVQLSMNAWKDQLRQQLNQAIRQAKNRSERSFTTESVCTFTPSGAVYLQVIVTHTA